MSKSSLSKDKKEEKPDLSRLIIRIAVHLQHCPLPPHILPTGVEVALAKADTVITLTMKSVPSSPDWTLICL